MKAEKNAGVYNRFRDLSPDYQRDLAFCHEIQIKKQEYLRARGIPDKIVSNYWSRRDTALLSFYRYHPHSVEGLFSESVLLLDQEGATDSALCPYCFFNIYSRRCGPIGQRSCDNCIYAFTHGACGGYPLQFGISSYMAVLERAPAFTESIGILTHKERIDLVEHMREYSEKLKATPDEKVATELFYLLGNSMGKDGAQPALQKVFLELNNKGG